MDDYCCADSALSPLLASRDETRLVRSACNDEYFLFVFSHMGSYGTSHGVPWDMPWCPVDLHGPPWDTLWSPKRCFMGSPMGRHGTPWEVPYNVSWDIPWSSMTSHGVRMTSHGIRLGSEIGLGLGGLRVGHVGYSGMNVGAVQGGSGQALTLFDISIKVDGNCYQHW